MADAAAAPAVAPAGPPKTAKRDGLRAMEIEMQAKWTAAKAFEVNAPKVRSFARSYITLARTTEPSVAVKILRIVGW